MNVYTSDRIEIEYDSYEKEFSMTLYDTYGHYIDTVKMGKDEMRSMYESLDKFKNNML